MMMAVEVAAFTCRGLSFDEASRIRADIEQRRVKEWETERSDPLESQDFDDQPEVLPSVCPA